MKMISQVSHVMTLANSIIGVSVLAMPFCFKQCGIILATLVLLLCSLLSRLACHFLVKSAVMSRRRNFELLAFHAFGHMGKFIVELFIIGFLVGTCIAFFVVMGDLGPQIIGKMIDKNPEDIRTSLLITTSVFIVLPLGLLRNVDSLSSLSTASIVFYICLVIKIMAESMQHIFAGDWHEHIYYWRPSGILQCLPIFSMALFCQTQLFEIYEIIPNVSLEKMNEVVRGALNMCTIVYLCVGFFGYIAFCTQPFSGNILMSLEPSISSEMIKLGFVFSIAFSFPLVIFPCRASLNSLLFKRVYTHEPSMNYLPETRFRCLTITIVAISLITGVLIPNIEFVLGLVGSTIGVMICLIFPAIFFISISSKHTNERLLAQSILFIGICIMVLGTYANLYAMEESSNTKVLVTTNKPFSQMNNLPLNLNKDDLHLIANIPKNNEILSHGKEKLEEQSDIKRLEKTMDAKDVRQEPPIPVERIINSDKQAAETSKPMENIMGTFPPQIKNIIERMKTLNMDVNKEPKTITKLENMNPVDSITLKAEEKLGIIEQKEKMANIQKNDNLINSDAIKKEESELAADGDAVNNVADERREELRKTLEKYKLEQLQMMQEQREILKDLKEQKQEMEKEKMRKAKDASELKKTEDKKNEEVGDPDKIKHAIEEALNKGSKTSDKKTNPEDTNSVILQDPIEPSNIVNAHDVPKQEDNKKDSIKESVAAKNEVLNRSINIEENIESPAVKLNNSGELPKGPILNALTKRNFRKAKSADNAIKADNNDNTIVANKENLDNNEVNSINGDRRIQNEYSIPIALKMRNQTKVDNVSVQLSNKNEENVQGIHRDILEKREREKRAVNVEVGNNTDAGLNTLDLVEESRVQNLTKDVDFEKCSKTREDVDDVITEPKTNSEVKSSKTGTTQASLIKTNIYLSEQGIADAISVIPALDLRGEFVKVKQRDLKAVSDSHGGDK